MYDPVEKAQEMASLVCRGDERKYYRFRPARFYGGIATADCVGCNLRCIFCWSWQEVMKPEAFGRFYSPEEVAKKLLAIVHQKNFGTVRISGNEPTLCREHLLKVLELIPKDLLFVLETNGILIGHDETYARDLARFENLHVRVSLKGASEEEFCRLSGADPEGFSLQLKALENLHLNGVPGHVAVMGSFSSSRELAHLRNRVGKIAPSLAELEVEEVVFYRDVEERLKKAKITCR